MARYDRKDAYYKKAKEEGRASRAFYKLSEIEGRYQLIKKGSVVLDLGASPGGWMEEASILVGERGLVVGIDILPLKITLRRNMRFIRADINDERTIELIRKEVARADVVISDMAPSTSGVKFRDSYLSYELAMRALHTAVTFLKEGGNFVVKIFHGEEFAGFKVMLSKYFAKVFQFRPSATRKSSREVYLVGVGYKL